MIIHAGVRYEIQVDIGQATPHLTAPPHWFDQLQKGCGEQCVLRVWVVMALN